MSTYNQTYSNRRIAKNTMLLYFRMTITIAIGLYTSRVLLKAFGVEDFGLYNVVGGVVSMLGFITASLGGATSRYITYYLGKGALDEVKRIFGNLQLIHLLLALMILVIGETVGLWFITTKLNIPPGSESIAFWVYQFSLISATLGVSTTPYNSVIIAHERLNVFAFLSIMEVTLKLFIVIYIQYFIVANKLIIYSFLFLCSYSFIRGLYIIYSYRHFAEVKVIPHFNKDLFTEIIGFSLWSMFGHLAIMGSKQGIDILLNLFFGTIVNAARAISIQIQSVIMQFCYNFQTALNPQLIKSYADGNLSHMHKLVIFSSKLSFFLLLALIMPICIEAEVILRMWLGEVPNHTVWFVRLMLVQSLFFSISNPLKISIQAKGNIKKTEIIEGAIIFSAFPISYLILKFFHFPPESVYVVLVFAELVAQIFRIKIILPQIKLRLKFYLKNVILPVIYVGIIASLFPLIITSINMCNIIIPSLTVILSCILSVSLSAYFIGYNTDEKKIVKDIMIKIMRRYGYKKTI